MLVLRDLLALAAIPAPHAGQIRLKPPPQQTAVTLNNVSVRFGNGRQALDGVSLRVQAGEFLSILGPSGCGKTTILRLIAGLVEPSSGTVATPLNGAHAGGRRDDIGFVFQDPTLMPWASVYKNIWLPLRFRGVSADAARDRIVPLLEKVGLADLAEAYPHELSGGMKMRVSIARALVTGPKLLLMDEPFAALDEITRFKLNDDLLELWSDIDCTVVFVTHSVYEAVYLSNRIAVMAPGRVADEFRVDSDYPRGSGHRSSPAYVEMCKKASHVLGRAMAKT